MTRLVVLDAALLGVVAAYAVWVSRSHRGSPISFFRGQMPRVGGERLLGIAVNGLVPGGLLFGTDGYGWGTRWVNALVFFAAVTAAYACVQVVHNRAVDRR